MSLVSNVSVIIVTFHLSCSFFLAFLADAQGGILMSRRYPGLRVLIPPKALNEPARLIIRLIQLDNKPPQVKMPELGLGEWLANRLIHVELQGPAELSRPILLEVPHYASLRNGEREISVMETPTGDNWTEYAPVVSAESIEQEVENAFGCMQDIDDKIQYFLLH